MCKCFSSRNLVQIQSATKETTGGYWLEWNTVSTVQMTLLSFKLLGNTCWKLEEYFVSN